jgi:transcription antitermination factor NusB
MRKRTLAREYAIQILYQIDVTGDSYEMSVHNFWHAHNQEEISEDIRDFTGGLVKGVIDNLQAIDKKIAHYATNWELRRMAVVDRNILRLASYELLFREDIPPKVSINEGVELAKKYSDLNAGKFVNGILDKIKLENHK